MDALRSAVEEVALAISWQRHIAIEEDRPLVILTVDALHTHEEVTTDSFVLVINTHSVPREVIDEYTWTLPVRVTAANRSGRFETTIKLRATGAVPRFQDLVRV